MKLSKEPAVPSRDQRTRICYEEYDLKQVVAKGVEGSPLRCREKDEDGRQRPYDRGYHAGQPASPDDLRRHAYFSLLELLVSRVGCHVTKLRVSTKGLFTYLPSGGLLGNLVSEFFDPSG